MTKLNSSFAILDVKQPDHMKLRDRINGNNSRIPVVIHGYITDIGGSYDGVSQEFTIEVESAEIEDD